MRLCNQEDTGCSGCSTTPTGDSASDLLLCARKGCCCGGTVLQYSISVIEHCCCPCCLHAVVLGTNLTISLRRTPCLLTAGPYVKFLPPIQYRYLQLSALRWAPHTPLAKAPSLPRREIRCGGINVGRHRYCQRSMQYTLCWLKALAPPQHHRPRLQPWLSWSYADSPAAAKAPSRRNWPIDSGRLIWPSRSWTSRHSTCWLVTSLTRTSCKRNIRGAS